MVLMYNDESFHITYGRDVQRSDETEKAYAAIDEKMLGHEPFDIMRDIGGSDLDAILAVLVARAFALRGNFAASAKHYIEVFDPDVSAHWQASEEFLKRLNRESLAAALNEAAIPGVTPAKKKKELVEMALRDLVPLGWLPKPLRTPCYKGPGSNRWADAKSAQLADEITAQAQAAE